MRLADILYFSPQVKFADIDLTNTRQMIEAFDDRVMGYYLDPADSLDSHRHSFAKGSLTLTAIDFIGLFFYGTGNSARIKSFCSELNSIKNLNGDQVEKITRIINDDFRNGLIHEGRIKSLGQFAIDIHKLIDVSETFSVINPDVFLSETIILFKDKIEQLKTDKEFQFQFKNRFVQVFKQEIGSAKST